jgi:CHAD domain-containing protein
MEDRVPKTQRPKDGQLKIEPDLTGDDALAQLLASLRRIEDGLGSIHDLVVAIDERVKAESHGR